MSGTSFSSVCGKSGSFQVAVFGEHTCSDAEFQSRNRHNFFEIIWIRDGSGMHHIDLFGHAYEAPALFILAPGQLNTIEQRSPTMGYVVRFISSLFRKESEFSEFILDTCLFDSRSSCPVIPVPDTLTPTLEQLFGQMAAEFGNDEQDRDSVVGAYLKILITHINRIKRQKLAAQTPLNDPQYVLFRSFKIAVEKEYRRQHSVQHYADRLLTTPRLLNTVSRKYQDKSAGEVIQERILLEATRSLYRETLSVKEISYELGFEDPAYFSRFFRKHTGTSPQQFRETALFPVEKYRE